jgi:YebC/PmpR family DNA-binding regulatory protein
MAGHSKWANIKHRKAKQDKMRGKEFTKLIREITVSAQSGGADPASNPRLRDAIASARRANMKNDTIKKAIDRGAGVNDGSHYEEIRYEGYGPGGIAILVDCVTDNRNRTVAEVRHAFTKFGGQLGTDGSVSYLFTKTGQLCFPPESDEATIFETALEAGASDVQTNEDGSIDVLCEPDDYPAVLAAMTEKKLEPAFAAVQMLASMNISVEGEAAETLQKMLDMLEDLDDVQEVVSNADLATEED